MDVILTQDVPLLGKTGDVVNVKDGHARNLLFPKKIAYAATPANLKRIQQLEKKRQEANVADIAGAQQIAEQISKASCTVSVEVNDQEKLYGSITEIDVAKALEVEGFQVDKKQIKFEQPIEELGIFEIGVEIHPEVIAKVRLWVTKK